MTRAETNAKYKNYHDILTEKYKGSLTFKDRVLSLGEFKKLHTLNWLTHEKEIVDNELDLPGEELRTTEDLGAGITIETSREVNDINESTSDMTYNITDVD